jgi:hypothetical protein
MKVFVNIYEVISDLHERGFTDDFEVRAIGIMWVQERQLLKKEDFLITECHRFLNVQGNEIVICAIVSMNFQVKGILVNHYEKRNSYRPMMIEKKISDLSSCVSDHDDFGYTCASD